MGRTERCPTLPDPAPAEEFVLRNTDKSELAAYSALRLSAGFNEWQESDYDDLSTRLVDGRKGHFVIEEIATGRMVAAADAEVVQTELLDGMGVLGWVMSSPDYRGKRLGYSVCAAVMQHLAKHGFHALQLSTDDHRVPAIKTYLNLGWRPWLYEPDMEEHWCALAEIYGRSFESLRALPEKFDYNKIRIKTLHHFCIYASQTDWLFCFLPQDLPSKTARLSAQKAIVHAKTV